MRGEKHGKSSGATIETSRAPAAAGPWGERLFPGFSSSDTGRIHLARCHAEIGRKPLAHELRRELLQGKHLLEHDQDGPRDVPARGLDVTVCGQRRSCQKRGGRIGGRSGGRS